MGWTTGGAGTDWEIGVPTGLGGNYGNPDPSNAVSGTHVIGNDLIGVGTYFGDYETNLAEDSNWVYSPPIDCTGTNSTTLYFQRHLNVEGSGCDSAFIEVSTDGSAWSEVWSEAGITTEDSAWSQFSYDISTWANDQPTVYVRFEIGETDGSWQYSGWNIDDLQIRGDGSFEEISQFNTIYHNNFVGNIIFNRVLNTAQ